jgi:hypothetical protein
MLVAICSICPRIAPHACSRRRSVASVRTVTQPSRTDRGRPTGDRRNWRHTELRLRNVGICGATTPCPHSVPHSVRGVPPLRHRPMAAHASATQSEGQDSVVGPDEVSCTVAPPTAHPASVAQSTPRRQYPRWKPYAGKPHVRLCAGGA